MISTFVLSSVLAVSAQAGEAQQDVEQAKTSGPQSEIIVEEPKTARERRIELRQMASSVLERPRWSQAIGTYDVPMCPKVFGLPEEAAEAIEARMRANAVEVGLNHKSLSEGCKHNTSVIFVPTGQGKAETWFDHNSDELDHLYSFERARVLEEDAPVRAWTYRIERPSGPAGVPNANADVASLSDFHRLAFMSARQEDFFATRQIRKPNKLGGATILIELGEADGKTLTQLADYASMRTFGNSIGIDPDAVPPARTILTLFQDDDAPEELTAFDKAVISMLYDTSSTANRSMIYGNIARRTARTEIEELTQEAAP